MPRAAPSFPAFDEWQKMSESEQDALLDALEAGQRRGRLAMRLLIGAGRLSCDCGDRRGAAGALVRT